MYPADDALLMRSADCPMKWWSKHQHAYPKLAEVFKRFFNIVAMFVSCKQMFGKTGFILNERRLRLKSTKVE